MWVVRIFWLLRRIADRFRFEFVGGELGDLQLAGGELWVTDLFNGLALIGAVSLSLVLQRRRGRREKAAAARASKMAR